MDVLDLLAREGMIAAASVAALRAHPGPAIAAPFDAGLVADDVIADLVAREAGTIVIDLEQGTLEHDAVRLLPEEVARKHLAIVMATEGGRSVRVAFANPLDSRAIAEVADTTRRAVRALVGTISGIRNAIDREYRGAATKTVPAPPIGAESTRRVASTGVRRAPTSDAVSEEAVPGTLPVHRLEQEATIEQRHEAFLLALIEKGVITRAEYGDALKRLLGRRG